jgi:hypothetical protein
MFADWEGAMAMSPSLGEIQAFLCVADHLDYKLAAEELEISPTGVKQRVEALQTWLNKLVIQDPPIEISAGAGDAFVPIALEILNRFEDACPTYQGQSVGAFGTSRIKMMAKIHLHDLGRFLAVANEGTYKGAAADFGCDVTTVQRSIQALEALTDTTFFSGRTTLTLTGDGEAFRETAAFIVKSLNDFRAVIPENFDPVFEELKIGHRILKRRQLELRVVADMIATTGKKQRGKVRMADVESALEVTTKAINAFEQGISYILNASKKSPDLDSVENGDTLHPLPVETECSLQPSLPDSTMPPTQAPQIEDEWFDKWQMPPQNKA